VSCGKSEDRHRLVEFASTYQVDHAIIFSDLIAADIAYEIFHNINPIIATSEPVTDPEMNSIHLDGSDGARQIVDSLVEKGRRNFAYIHGRTTSWIDRQRQEWFEQALASHSLGFVAEGSGDYTYESGYKETVMLLRRNKVDALICSNDVMAIGAIDAARNVLGRHVPDNLAVVGQDGVPLASWECHQLTTLVCDQDKVSKQVIAMINGASPTQTVSNKYVQIASVTWGATT
jgi:DNA-binding LacI/PurR family transcriptional regulator